MEHFLAAVLEAWVKRGVTNEARSILGGQGWELRFCFRFRLIVWVAAAIFSVLLIAATSIVGRHPDGWKLVAGFLTAACLCQYYVAYITRYRVVVDEVGLRLHRMLMSTREIAWSDVSGFGLTRDEASVRLVLNNGKTLDLRTALNGLSAVRRCLAAFTTAHDITPLVWSRNDAILCEKLPSWRCDPEDLEGDPFSPLGLWKTASFVQTVSMSN